MADLPVLKDWKNLLDGKALEDLSRVARDEYTGWPEPYTRIDSNQVVVYNYAMDLTESD